MTNHSEHTINTVLFAKYFSGEATDEELKQVNDWKNSSVENKKEFNEYNLVWLDTGIVKDSLSTPIDTNKAWKNIKTRIDKNKIIKLKPKFNWKFTLKIAAMIAIIFGCFWLVKVDVSITEKDNLVATNKILNFTFSDSSKVVMNKNSEISYPIIFDNKERKIKLSGEAYFKITPNKKKPFIIEVDKAIVKVLGTSFVVKEIKPDSLVKVVVESGKVSFSFQNENVILTKDMSATLNLRTKKITIDSNVNKNIGAWKSKKLHFRSTSMKEVIHQIEKLYEVNFEIKNPSILNCELSATFDNEDLEDILMIIESTFGFQIEHIYNKIVIKGNGC